MSPAPTHQPRRYQGVMISSTFSDIEEHRQILIKAVNGQGLTARCMENDSAKPDLDVIESSLKMVCDASAYIGVITLKYGQTPHCATRNPNDLSITELEFNEAMRLHRPILLFIMGDEHATKKAHIEHDPVKEKKLSAFRERAKQMKAGSEVHRVYATFNSPEDLTPKAIQAVADLYRYLEKIASPSPQKPPPAPKTNAADPIPTPPAFYAEPPYIGSHNFVGRAAQLDSLNDWANPADAHPVLLFDAIGGSGKSMLTWEWTTKHAPLTRTDWAGRFWYSFYERGAIMADFCRRALTYITGEPLETFNKQKTPELANQLLHHLRHRPWLIILDGLERVLVAYHRIDAAEVNDEEASQPTDKIAQRDPCTAIRPEDDDLLRALAAASPSKVLVTSRLVPRVLLNAANQAIPGVLRVSLSGLRPADAEALLRSCEVSGDSLAIQNYLKSHCDCHPLVTGVLGGLIGGYLPDPGSFDAWAADPDGGGSLNLADLDLVQKRNNILKAGLDALPENSLRLISTLALLSEAVDFSTLIAIDPNLPPERTKLTPASAVPTLSDTVRDLLKRGLLQVEGYKKRYDLHPVVRGIVAGRLRPDEREGFGQRVVDHFSDQSHSPYEEAETLEDLRTGLHLVRTLLKIGRYKQACELIKGGLVAALLINVEAPTEVLSILRPFFVQGWTNLPVTVNENDGSFLANSAATALENLGQLDASAKTYGVALIAHIRLADWHAVRATVSNLSLMKTLANRDRCSLLALELANVINDEEQLFRARLDRFIQLASLGLKAEANVMSALCGQMRRDWSRNTTRPGYAECQFAQFRLFQGNLTEGDLARGETGEGR